MDQLIIQNTWNGNYGSLNETPFTLIVQHLMRYANGMDNHCVFFSYDREWTKGIIRNLAPSRDPNPIINYCNLRNQKEYQGKPIDIVEGFLVLESDAISIN